jgi:hypothetical protein
MDWLSDDGNIGAQTDGTTIIPYEAQPNNRPWDTGGGVLGGYGADVLNVLKFGVGVAAKSYDNRQLLDYKRFEATQGGAFQQGVATNSIAAPVALKLSPLLLVGLLVGGYFLFLHK